MGDLKAFPALLGIALVSFQCMGLMVSFSLTAMSWVTSMGLKDRSLPLTAAGPEFHPRIAVSISTRISSVSIFTKWVVVRLAIQP